MKILRNLALLICVLLGGCSRSVKPTPHEGEPVEQPRPIQDFQVPASDIVKKMLLHTEFARYTPANQAQLHLSDFINDTSNPFHMASLLDDVRSQLDPSGKFKISRLRGQAGTVAYLKSVAELRALEKRGSLGKLPNYILSGKISEFRWLEGKTPQSSFRLTLIATNLVGKPIFEDASWIGKPPPEPPVKSPSE